MTKLEQAARLKEVEDYLRDCANSPVMAAKVTALREALAEQAEQEPVAWLVQYKDCHTFVWGRKPEFIVDGVVEPLYAAPIEPVKQEPVGVVEGSGEWGIAGVLVAGVPIGTKLYAAPVRTKDLTDDEAQKLWNDTSSIVPMWAHHLHFARAVIAADREKNK